jgi:phage tail protein X
MPLPSPQPSPQPSHSLEILYLTRPGDRWDTIAHKVYGDATRYEPIRRANPDAPRGSVLPGGLHLAVPVLTVQADPPAASLPPWKRARG